MMKIHHYEKITHANLINLIIWGLLIKFINFALLKLNSFDYFDTFPGKIGQIKIKYHLSQAKAEIGAELGNTRYN